MTPPALPPSLSLLRDQYKRKQARFQRWLVAACEKRQIDPFTAEIQDGGDNGDEASTAPKKKGKAKGKGKGRCKGKKSAKANPAAAPPGPCVMTVNQLVRLASALSDASDGEKISSDVLSLLDEVIEARSKVAEHFVSPKKASIHASNVTHKFFTDTLKKVLRVLKACGVQKKADESDVDVETLSAGELVLRLQAVHLTVSTDGLEDVDYPETPEDPSKWIPASQQHLLKGPSKPAGTPASQRPLSQFLLEEEVDELAVAAFCLLSDVEGLAKYIGTTWVAYAKGEVSLATAAALSSFGTYEDVLEAFFGLKNRGFTMDHAKSLLDSEDLVDFIHFRTYNTLTQFVPAIPKNGSMPLPTPGFFPPFRPERKRSEMSGREREAEDMNLIMCQLGEVASVCVGASAGVLMYEDALYRDTRTYVETPSHPIRLHLVFEWSVWLSSVHACRANLLKPLETALATIDSILESEKKWATGPLPYDPVNMAGTRNEMEQNLVNLLKRQVYPDSPGATIMRRGYENMKRPDGVAGTKKHQDFRRNPWAAGCLQLNAVVQAFALGVEVINRTGHLTTTLQLYHTLVVYKEIKPIPILDELLVLCCPTMFGVPDPPQKDDILTSNYASVAGLTLEQIKRGAKFKEEGRGTLPVGWGGSFLADLVAVEPFNLTPTFVDELVSGKEHAPLVDRRFLVGPFHDAKIAKEGRCAIGPHSVFDILDKLKIRCEEDLAKSALAIDFFTVERAGIQIFQRWHDLVDPLFLKIHGPNYQEHHSQNTFLFAFLFYDTEDGKKRPGKEGFALAKQAFLEKLESTRAVGPGGINRHAQSLATFFAAPLRFHACTPTLTRPVGSGEDLGMTSLLALTTRKGASLYQLGPSADAQLVLKSSSPTPTPSCCLTWHADGSKFLAVGATIRVSSRYGELLYEVKRSDRDGSSAISSAHFLGRDSIVFASGETAYIYANCNEPPTELGGHPSSSPPITSLALNADESLLASCAGSSIIVHNLTHSTLTTLHARPKSAYSTVKFHPARRTCLAAGTAVGVVHLFDTTKPSAPLKSISLSGGAPLHSPITNLAFQHPIGQLLVACSEKGTLGLVDTKLLKLAGSWEVGMQVEKGAMTMDGSGRTVVLAGRGAVRILDLKLRTKSIEVKIGDGTDDILSVALEPTKTSRVDRSSSPSKNAVASPLLLESVNRLRQSKRASDLLEKHLSRPPVADACENEPEPALTTARATRLAAMQAAFPSVQLLPPAPAKRVISDDLPPSRLAFAESISREARTSTIRASSVPSQIDAVPRTPRSHESSSNSHSPTPPHSTSFDHNLDSSRLRSSSISHPVSLSQKSTHQRSLSVTSGTPSIHLPSLLDISGYENGGQIRRSSLVNGLGSPARRDRRSMSVSFVNEKEDGKPSLGGTAREGMRASQDEEVNAGMESSGKGKETVHRKREAVEGREDGKSGDVRSHLARPSKVIEASKASAETLSPRHTDSVASIEETVETRSHQGHCIEAMDLRATVRDVVEEYNQKSREDIKLLHVEVLRQAFEQKSLMERCFGGELARLREENATLRAENDRLRSRS
ncbi:hypothetical protein P7C70_g552, partial [Phenoliferia sp. Uapishka_3]